MSETFTNVWDITQPPDTQPANLLGQDTRNLKLDIAQRMVGSGIGLDADKPVFEAIFGGQPNPQDGVGFWASDTGKIYQWNGTAWVDVTSSFRASLNVATYIPTASSANIIQSVSVPAIYVVPGFSFRVTSVLFNNSGHSCTIDLGYNNDGTSTYPLLGTTTVPNGAIISFDAFGMVDSTNELNYCSLAYVNGAGYNPPTINHVSTVTNAYPLIFVTSNATGLGPVTGQFLLVNYQNS